MLARAAPVLFFAVAINVTYTRVSDRKQHHGRFGAPERRKPGARGATAGEPALATSLLVMLYADDAGDVLQSLEKPRKRMGMIVAMCAVSSLPYRRPRLISCIYTRR